MRWSLNERNRAFYICAYVEGKSIDIAGPLYKHEAVVIITAHNLDVSFLEMKARAARIDLNSPLRQDQYPDDFVDPDKGKWPLPQDL